MLRFAMMLALFASVFVSSANSQDSLAARTFTITVNYNQSPAEMIAAGKFGYIDEAAFPGYSDVEKRIATGRKGQHKIQAVLFHFNQVIRPDEVIKTMAKAGFRPAIPAELLAFGTTRPELQRLFPIVALGRPSLFADDYEYAMVLDMCYDNAPNLPMCFPAAVKYIDRPYGTLPENPEWRSLEYARTAGNRYVGDADYAYCVGWSPQCRFLAVRR